MENPIDKWFCNNFLVLISDKCRFMILGRPNPLPNFKCKNIKIKNSFPEKLLGFIINNKLDFTEHLNAVRKKANPNLYAPNKISRFLSPEQHVLVINTYIKSLFKYCLLAWMFCCQKIIHKMSKIHAQSLLYYRKTTRMIFKIS